ncbi:MAG TPA: M28 family peptidase [Thermoanaerobaculia bacterium]|jgi:Zn-dependent M28 family amino/carboxypeptidase|nr:M28 family peptidase [Thermoanaerobaculia bacterium]
MLRSLLRIVVATCASTVVLFILFAIVIRQPVIARTASRGGPQADAGRLQRDVAYLSTTALPRDARHPENLHRTAAWIAKSFRDSGARVSLQTFPARGRLWENVMAEFGPADPAQAVLVVGAHYDAFGEVGIRPGADDNASGTAGVLELARLLGRRNPSMPVMLVAYTNEEPPFFGSDDMGSAVHAQSLARSHRSVNGMICLEMIGYYSPHQSWPTPLFSVMYPSRGDFIAVAGGWPDRNLARWVKRGILGAGGVPVVSFTGPRETSDASDQRNYWSRGWPAVMVTDTAFLRNPNYHTSGDTAATLDYRRMAAVVDGVFNAATSAR